MIALCAVASVVALTPNMAWPVAAAAEVVAAGGGGGGFGGGGFGGGHAGGFSGGVSAVVALPREAVALAAANFAARGISGGNFGNSFARAPHRQCSTLVPRPGNRFAAAAISPAHSTTALRPNGFRHGRRFFAGGAGYDGYWDYPDYAYDNSLLRQRQLLCRAAARAYVDMDGACGRFRFAAEFATG